VFALLQVFYPGRPDEKNTPFNTQIVHKAIFGDFYHRDVCVIDVVFIQIHR
jgi:hypothetical protein